MGNLFVVETLLGVRDAAFAFLTEATVLLLLTDAMLEGLLDEGGL